MSGAETNAGQSLLRRYALPPEEIYRSSFKTVDALLAEVPAHVQEPWSELDRQVVRRTIHATGDPALAGLVRFTPNAAEKGVAALRRGAPIYTDVRMVAAGINERLARAVGSPVRVLIDAVRAEEYTPERGVTRSAAAVEAALDDLGGAVVAIGNAPTALLALLDALDEGRCEPPALIVGMPVGFVATRESKAALLERPYPAISIVGTRGGSAAAAATVNALLAAATDARRSAP